MRSTMLTVVPLASVLAVSAGATETGRSVVLAQSGSFGGTVGKGEKSVSGGEDAPRTASPVRRREGRSRETDEGRRPRPAGRAASAAAFDGAWVVRSFGETCSGGTSQAVVITSGRIIGQDSGGTVSPSGDVRTSAQFQGMQVTGSGKLTGRSGQGTFRQSDGCVGRWIATKQ